MPNWLRQNTTATLGIGPFLDETDGKTTEPNLTLHRNLIRVKKNGNSWSQKNETTNGSHSENGWYDVILNAIDTNEPGRLIVAVHISGSALPVWNEYMVVPSTVFDAMVSGVEWLHVDAMKPDWSISSNTLTVRKPDDTQIAYQKTLSTTVGANPVTGAT